MTRSARLVLSSLVLLAGCSTSGRVARLPPEQLPAIALGKPGEARDAAIARLRELGPAGLDMLLGSPQVAAALGASGDARLPEQEAARLAEAVDRVAGQKDALASRLYWHEDLVAAEAEARRLGRPILSLRLLGRLDEDLSCANSRFFRTVLYPNAQVSQVLRERFVLHWEMVRPVPKLTVDFGDGRVLETTITGNSIHYVLLPDGRPIDAIPGLWGAQAFLAELQRAEALAGELAPLPAAEASARLQAFHARRLVELKQELVADAAKLPDEQRQKLLEQLGKRGGAGSQVPDDVVFSTGSFVSFPDGAKMRVEQPIIRALLPGARGMEGEIGNDVWTQLAKLHQSECRLDEASRAMARRKNLGLSLLGWDPPRAPSVEPLFESLQRSVAEDTVRNRWMTGARLHEWFASGTAPRGVDDLNARVYSELFKSPVNDAWLGLVPPDAYSGLAKEGRKGSDS